MRDLLTFHRLLSLMSRALCIHCICCCHLAVSPTETKQAKYQPKCWLQRSGYIRTLLVVAWRVDLSWPRLSTSSFQFAFMTQWVFPGKGLLLLATRQIYRWIFGPGSKRGCAVNLPNNKHIILTILCDDVSVTYAVTIFADQICYKSDLNSCKCNKSITHDFISRCSF